MLTGLVLVSIVIGLSLLNGDVTAAVIKPQQQQYLRLRLSDEALSRLTGHSNSRAVLKAGYGSQQMMSMMPAAAASEPVPQVFIVSAPAPSMSDTSKPAQQSMPSYMPAPPPQPMMMKYPPAMPAAAPDPHASAQQAKPAQATPAETQSQSYRVIYVQPPAPAKPAPTPAPAPMKYPPPMPAASDPHATAQQAKPVQATPAET